MKNIILLILTVSIIQPCLAVPRKGGVFENSVATVVFSGQRKVIRGKFSRRAQVKFTTNEGQEIDFPVTKVRRKRGVTRLNYLVPTIVINDSNGNSLTDGNDDLFMISGQLEIIDKRLISNRQLFDQVIYLKPSELSESVEISSTVNGEPDSIFVTPKVSP